MKSDRFEWPKNWPDVIGANTRMLLIGLCVRADDQGETARSRKELASFSGASVATIDSCIRTLILADCLDVAKPGRDDMGSFGVNRYILRLENPRVRTIFEFWGPVARRSLSRLKQSSAAKQSGIAGQDFPATAFEAPLPETSLGPYKDSRASSSSSSNFPSLPTGAVSADRLLDSRVRQVWNVLGEGADPDRAVDLLRSLLIEIPKAIAKGFDFEADIVPCLEEATGYFRSERLWSFKVVFERDLPRFHLQRSRNVGSGRSRSP